MATDDGLLERIGLRHWYPQLYLSSSSEYRCETECRLSAESRRRPMCAPNSAEWGSKDRSDEPPRDECSLCQRGHTNGTVMSLKAMHCNCCAPLIPTPRSLPSLPCWFIRWFIFEPFNRPVLFLVLVLLVFQEAQTSGRASQPTNWERLDPEHIPPLNAFFGRM